jgi:hypothetical protein
MRRPSAIDLLAYHDPEAPPPPERPPPKLLLELLELLELLLDPLLPDELLDGEEELRRPDKYPPEAVEPPLPSSRPAIAEPLK